MDRKLEMAKINLEKQTQPLGEGAAVAHEGIQTVLLQLQESSRVHKEMLLAVARVVRDVLMLQCRALCRNYKDRGEFIDKLREAHGGVLDTRGWTYAQVLNAYAKDPWNEQFGFMSRNKERTMSKGGRPPRCNEVSSFDSEKPVYLQWGVYGVELTAGSTHSNGEIPWNQVRTDPSYLIFAELQNILMFFDLECLPVASYGEYREFEGFRVYWRPDASKFVETFLREPMCELVVLSTLQVATSLMILRAFLKDNGLGGWDIDEKMEILARPNYPAIRVFQRTKSDDINTLMSSWTTIQWRSWLLEMDLRSIVRRFNNLNKRSRRPVFNMKRVWYVSNKDDYEIAPEEVCPVSKWPSNEDCCEKETGLQCVLERVRCWIKNGKAE